MSKHPAVLLAGVAAVSFAVAAPVAAEPAPAGQEWHTTTVALPDGYHAEIRYFGDVPPQVTVAMPTGQALDHGVRGRGADEADIYGGIPRARRVIQPRPVAALPHATLP